MSERVLVEKEFAVFVRGRFGAPDKEVGRVNAYSQDHAIYVAKTQGHVNICNALNVEGRLYKRYHQA